MTEFIENLLEHTGYEKALQEERTADAEARLENIRNSFQQQRILKEITRMRGW